MSKIDLTQHSVPLWILEKGIVNEKGEPFEFRDHLFLWDILADQSPNQVLMKCAQIGASVSMNLKAFFYADKLKLSSIYTMPSDSDVQEFSKTKTDKIFTANPEIQSRILLDNVGLKEIGEKQSSVFIYFKGTRSKAAPIATTTDLLIHDELDRSDLSIIEIYESRIANSKYKGTWYLSNPSIMNAGVDIAWRQSDRKEWFITCLKCKHEQFLKWEENVDEVRKIYVCSSCNTELSDNTRRLGRWKPTGTGEWSGYHISQMMAPWHSAAALIKVKENRGMEYFKNFVLGEPYTIGELPTFRQMIMDSWTPDTLDQKPFYMGVDIGKEKHWVLGSDEGIFAMGKCQSREELETIIERYNPTVVMDSGPERTWAEEFKQKYPKLYLCFYRKDKDVARMVEWGGEKGSFEEAKNIGYVWIDRNRLIDELVYNMMRGEILYSLSREDLERYISHWETMRRVVEEVPAMRTERYVWESTTGVNHWASATWFYWLALKRKPQKVEVLKEHEPKPEQMIQVTSEGMKMRPLKEVMEDIKDSQV